jgi:hypothetical protein
VIRRRIAESAELLISTTSNTVPLKRTVARFLKPEPASLTRSCPEARRQFLPLALLFCLTFSLSMPIPVNAGAAPPTLASADWSVNGAHNLASNPPSLDAVQDFYDRAFGTEESGVKVCEFRFADLRNSGNLSLIVSVDPEGRQWPECNQLYIFDRTPRGFESYETDRAYGQDLVNSVLDINHDGRHELVLWGGLAPVATGFERGRLQLTCNAQWPLVFAWTGNGYSEVSDQYKDYYRNYLESLETQLAAYSSESGLAAAQTVNPAPTPRGFELSVGPGGEGFGAGHQGVGVQIAPPAPTPEAAPTPDSQARRQAQRDYACTRMEAAKTEAFLGINSDSTMSAAIKDSESTDPQKRILAAAIFSYLGSQEAKADLKTLSSDADSRVADIAKETASIGEDPIQRYRTMTPGGASFRW